MSDPATDPNLDLRLFPQDPQARQPGERLARWLARRCSPRDDAPEQEGDELASLWEARRGPLASIEPDAEDEPRERDDER
jgi:hypothetical protein